MKRSVLALLLSVLALVLLVDGSRSPVKAVANPVYTYFPTGATNDGRMLCLAGLPLETMAGATIEMRIGVPSGVGSFEVGVFDGDSGKNAAGELVDPGGSWDAGTAQLEYTLYADPLAAGTGSVVIGRWFGNSNNPTSSTNWTASSATMPDNNWWNVTVNTTSGARSPAGHYFYRFVVRLLDFNASAISAFKLRTSAQVSVVPNTIAYMGVLNQYTDAYAVYPTWAGDYPPADPFFFTNAPTTYDGSWRFYLDLNATTTELRFWDGDCDYGNQDRLLTEPSLLALGETVDTKDPDTPDTLPDFAQHGYERTEAQQGSGQPQDDSDFDLFRRGPGVEYQVVDPRGKVYRVGNPSGNLEWEQFRVTTDDSALRSAADYSPAAADDDTAFVNEPRLPAGAWRVDVAGQDLANLCFLRFERSVLGVDAVGDPITPLRPLLLGDLVWLDTDVDGVKDADEAGVAGITVDILDSAGAYIASTLTDAGGLYSFNVGPGTYTVRLNYSNFSPGRPLLGLNSTTGGNKRTATLTAANDMTLDFGVGVGGPNPGPIPISGVVWHDQNGNGQQGAAEPGFSGVTVTLAGLGGFTATTTTDVLGNYEFSGLAADTYTVAVDTATLPSGLVQTYDVDGLLTAHQATVIVSSLTVNSGVAFGYTAASAGSGPFTTQTQGGWGDKPSGSNPGAKLAANFSTVYPGGAVTIGGVRTLTFTSAAAIEKFLPQGAAAEALTSSYVNPTGKLGVLSGQTLALQLNVDFSAAAAGGHRTGLGALTVQSGKLVGYTVTQVLVLCNAALGGNNSVLPAGVKLTDLNDTASRINECFVDGTTNTGYIR